MTDIIKTLKQIDNGGVHLPRRALLGGLLGVIAAPAIVKASSLMAVKSMPPTDYLLEAATQHYAYGYTEVGYTHSITDGRKLSRFAQAIMPGLDMLPMHPPQYVIDMYNKIGQEHANRHQ
jgi:hypothetical protein